MICKPYILQVNIWYHAFMKPLPKSVTTLGQCVNLGVMWGVAKEQF